jgi:hypothetical protein
MLRGLTTLHTEDIGTSIDWSQSGICRRLVSVDQGVQYIFVMGLSLEAMALLSAFILGTEERNLVIFFLVF